MSDVQLVDVKYDGRKSCIYRSGTVPKHNRIGDGRAGLLVGFSRQPGSSARNDGWEMNRIQDTNRSLVKPRVEEGEVSLPFFLLTRSAL